MPSPKLCDLCGRAPSPLFEIAGQPSGCSASICSQDGLVFLSPSPTRDELSQYYAEFYDDDFRADIKGEDPRASAHLDNFETSYSRFKHHLKVQTPAILDVGAGMGWAIDVLKRHLPGGAFYAIEASRYCRESLQKRNIPVISNEIYSTWPGGQDKRFDLIHLRHVFEHLAEPLEALELFKKALNKDGLIYLCVPDMLNPMRPIKSFWFRTVHSHYYTEDSLRRVLHKAGLEVVQMERDLSRFEFWVVAKASSQAHETTSAMSGRVHALRIRGVLAVALAQDFLQNNLSALKRQMKTWIAQ